MSAPVPANFTVFVTNATTMINEVYRSEHALIYPRVATTIPVSSEQLTMGWMGIMPKPRGWFGPRVVHEPNAETFTVSMLPYENTYALDRFRIDDDLYGVYYPILTDFAIQSKRSPDFEFRDLLENRGLYGNTSRQAGLDALSHWNTAHPVDVYDASKGTFINDFSAGGQSVGGVTVGGALGVVGLTTLYEYMRTIKGQDNERLGVRADLLMIPPTLLSTAEFLLKNQFMAPPTWGGFAQLTSQVGAADNELRRFGLDYVENENLLINDRWYLLDTKRSIKPFVWGLRQAPVQANRVSETDPFVFDNHKFLWGMWYRAAATWGPAFLSARSGTT